MQEGGAEAITAQKQAGADGRAELGYGKTEINHSNDVEMDCEVSRSTHPRKGWRKQKRDSQAHAVKLYDLASSTRRWDARFWTSRRPTA